MGKFLYVVYRLNDLVATGPDSFYATIFYTLGLTVDFMLLYPGGGVLRYDQGKTTVLDTGLVLANGINISPDKRWVVPLVPFYLYLAQSIH